jgi:AraC family transcriptional regulator of adaptative response / DNA-3-methyladenine glycosylase II
MSVEAVVTTGIYCRPGCPGRPNPGNTRRYRSAAEAEAAGFRACHRCRPYRDAAALDMVSAPELVCRGVQLVLAGALDGANERELAVRLGASTRHLRRLFLEHAGVTPDGLARSSRAHFARRLLDDTDLSVTEIAYASGFGSVRQFNRCMLETFRATPTELRAKRRSTDRLAADGGLCLRLPFVPPLDWDALLTYLAARAIPGVEHVGDGVYRRTVDIDGDTGVVEVEHGGPDHLVLRAHLPHWEGLIHVVARVRRIFGLDADVATAHDALAGDPVVGGLVRRRPGLRVAGTWDPFELAVRAVLGQQVSVAGASTLAGRVVARHGTPVPGLGALGLSSRFPTADTLADADLVGVGLPATRAGAVRALGRAVAEGKVVLDGTRPLPELVESLTAVEGIGPWTAQYVALRTGEPDAFPTGDLGLRRAAGREDGTTLRTAGLDRLAERWRPWRATAAMHLWTGAPAGLPAGGPAHEPAERTFATMGA